MKKLFTWRVVVRAIIFLLITIAVVAVVYKATDSFETWNPSEVFARDLNEENLLYKTYEEFELRDSVTGITFKESNGVIKIDGDFNKDDNHSSSLVVPFATVELEAGTYTFTCFDDPAFSKYYAYIEYTGSDNEKHIVYADFKNVNTSGRNESGIIDGSLTFNLTEDTTCSIKICVQSGNTFKNVKARPCLVLGDEKGEFYK